MPLGMEVGLGRGLIVTWGPSSPAKGHSTPIFSPCLLWPNGWMDQYALGVEIGLDPGNIVLDEDPAPP